MRSITVVMWLVACSIVVNIGDAFATDCPITPPDCGPALRPCSPDCNSTGTNPAPYMSGGPIIDIPVVFHVIKRGDGTGNLSLTTLQHQIDVLNLDFAGLTGGADTGIHFFLASEEWITNTNWFDNLGCPSTAKEAKCALSASWNPLTYLNVVTGNFQAMNPGDFGETTDPCVVNGTCCDGIAIEYTTINGQNALYNNGHALTHEVGHWLGLKHTFPGTPYGSCSESNCYAEGDLLCDTPLEPIEHLTTPCASNTNCDGSVVDNFMSHIPDACMLAFTPEQAARMRCTAQWVRPGLTYDGTISTNTTWAGIVNLSADVVVPAGVTLTVAAGTQVFVSPVDASSSGSDHARVELRIQGTLTVQGTQTNHARFQSAAATPSEGDWYGIKVENGGVLSIAYAETRHARYGVSANSSGSVSISNSVFENNSVTDIQVTAATSGCSILNNTINVGTGDGAVLDSGSATINGNTITGSATSTSGVTVTNQLGNYTLDGNLISGVGAGPGVFVTNGHTTMTNNVIWNSNIGILVENGAQTLGTPPTNGNEIYGCTEGISVQCIGGGNCPNQCQSLNVTVRSSNIHGNTYGVHISKTAAVNLGTSGSHGSLGNNIIAFNTTYCIWNSSSCGTIQAVGNYFGGCPPSCTSGSVNTANYLCSPPSLSTITLDAPDDTRISAIHPNPFNPITTVDFELKESAWTTISIYNVKGQLVRVETLGAQPAGQHNWVWKGADQNGNSVSSGVYFIILKAGTVTDRKKAVLLK